jgi:hypothetical protein
MKLYEGILVFSLYLIFLTALAYPFYFISYSYLQYTIAEDVVQVLYLKHGPSVFYVPWLAGRDLTEISDKTALCMEISDRCDNDVYLKYGDLELSVGR